jgi:hypothetical protein
VVRTVIAPWDEDRQMAPDIAAALLLLGTGLDDQLTQLL